MRAWCAGAVACLPLPALPATDTITRLDEIVVSAPGPMRALRGLPQGVSIITSADIERSTATTLSDLLSREANLNLQSYFGNDRPASIDMRGMGATSVSNVLVLVDGVRLNENDLSGPDLSSTPLSQIERVEIIRGGGAVRYGNGAVGGVINIITKRGKSGTASLDLAAKRGAFDTTDARLAAAYGAGPLTATLNVSGLDTDGYRQNGFVHARDGMLELRLAPTGRLDFLDMYVRVAQHRDDSGLPGPVSAAAFAGTSAERRASRAPFDRSSTDDRRYTAGMSADLGLAGHLELQTHYRDRENPFVIGFNPAAAYDNQVSQIRSQRHDLQARYELPLHVLGYDHVVTAGFDHQEAEYGRFENGSNRLDASTRRLGRVDSRGTYAAATIALPHHLSIDAGVRTGSFDTQARDERYTRGNCQTVLETVFVDIDPGPGVILIPIPVPRQVNCIDAYRVQGNRGGTWRNRGAELGLTWQPERTMAVFAGWSRHFRNPNVDELLLAATDLRPQSGETVQAGVRLGAGERAELSVTLFHMRVDDEILFGRDPVTGGGINRNFENPTRRVGGELEARWRPSDRIALRGNLGYVDARFQGTDVEIPLVPQVTLNASLEWAPRSWLRWLLSGRYVGARHDGNDFSGGQFPRLPAYAVWDAAVRFSERNFAVTAGINNLFNEKYSTIAYSATYYPMPERNAYVSLQAKF